MPQRDFCLNLWFLQEKCGNFQLSLNLAGGAIDLSTEAKLLEIHEAWRIRLQSEGFRGQCLPAASARLPEQFAARVSGITRL